MSDCSEFALLSAKRQRQCNESARDNGQPLLWFCTLPPRSLEVISRDITEPQCGNFYSDYYNHVQYKHGWISHLADVLSGSDTPSFSPTG